MQNHRTPFNAIDSYLNQAPNRVNYVEMISRPPIPTIVQQETAPPPSILLPHDTHNNGNNDNHDVHMRRSNEFTPPGATSWIPSKKSVASSPAPNRVLPQPQTMHHMPYQATVTMLPTPPPMNYHQHHHHSNNNNRLSPNTNNSTHQHNINHTTQYQQNERNLHKQQSTNHQDLEFPPLNNHHHWPPSSFHEGVDRERWRHSEDNGGEQHERQEGVPEFHSLLYEQQHHHQHHDKSYLDKRDHHLIPNDQHAWWKGQQDSMQRSSIQSSQHASISFRNDQASSKEHAHTNHHHHHHSNNNATQPPAKKRSQNAFFVFSSERRHEIRAEQPRIRNSELNKLLGKEWKELSQEHKSHYKHRAEILKEQAKQENNLNEQSSFSNHSNNGHHHHHHHHGSLFVTSSPSSSTSSPPPPYASSSPSHYQQYRLHESANHDHFSTHQHSRNHPPNDNNAAPRHLSISSERSHDALFVAANHGSPTMDWHSNSDTKQDDDEDDDNDNERRGLLLSEEEEQQQQQNRSSSPSSSFNGMATTSSSHNRVNVASHSGAAEAEALAGLTSPIQRIKRSPCGRYGETRVRVKRPPNAYLLFNRDIRHKILEDSPNLTVSQISKEISERWSNISEEHKAYYNKEAARLKQIHMDDNPNFIYTRRSKAELIEAGYRSRPSKKRKVVQDTTGSHDDEEEDPGIIRIIKPRKKTDGRDPRGRKKKRLKNPTAPKHPMSGFLFYSISIRSEIVANMPKAKVGEISKVVSERWRELNEQERAPWVQKAKEDKERYAREMESFTAALMQEGLEGESNGNSTAHHHHHHHQHHHHHHSQGNMSPVELDSHTIGIVAQMVNPRGEHLLPPLSASSSPRQYQVLPATPRNDD